MALIRVPVCLNLALRVMGDRLNWQEARGGRAGEAPCGCGAAQGLAGGSGGFFFLLLLIKYLLVAQAIGQFSP